MACWIGLPILDCYGLKPTKIAYTILIIQKFGVHMIKIIIWRS